MKPEESVIMNMSVKYKFNVSLTSSMSRCMNISVCMSLLRPRMRVEI